MSDFDLSLGIEPEEKLIKISGHLTESEYNELQAYVGAINAVRQKSGAKDIDYKYIFAKLFMRGLDTERAEMPDYLVKKVKGARKRKSNDDEPIAQAAE